MISLIQIISISVFVLMANVSYAYDFYGASVTVKEVSMSMWRMGINGNYPIIDSITPNSPAAKAGLSQGNIILSVNDRAIKNVSDLDTVTAAILLVKILKGYDRETITINRIAIESEKAKLIAEDKKSVVEVATPIRKNTNVEETLNNSPPIVFNDSTLEKKYGNKLINKVTPVRTGAELAIGERFWRLDPYYHDYLRNNCSTYAFGTNCQYVYSDYRRVKYIYTTNDIVTSFGN
ncbi:MAG: PDZ domain-containing protein [bacterium]